MSVEWADSLQRRMHGDVTTKKDVLKDRSRDWSIFEVQPAAVAFPDNVDDVKEIVAFVNEHKDDIPSLSVTPRAAGTGMSGGSLTESLMVDFSHLDHIGPITDDSGVAQPGTYFRDFDEQTREQGTMFPSYPSSKDICAIGGMVANNCGGEKSLRYGKTKDLVKRINMITADGSEIEVTPISAETLEQKKQQDDFEGELYRELHRIVEENKELIEAHKPTVSKNSTGYNLWDVWDGETFDMTKLITGSQGTLGVITETELELVPVQDHSATVVAFVEELTQMVELVNAVLEYDPECLEAFDRKTLDLILENLDEVADDMGMSKMEMLRESKDEVDMFLEHGIPEFIVMVRLADSDADAVREKQQAVHDELDKHDLPNLALDDERAEKYWWGRRNSFKLLSEKMGGGVASPFIDDTCVAPEEMPEFLPKLYETLERYGIEPTLAGHAGSGNFHIIPVMDLESDEDRNKIPKVMDEIHKLVIEHGGQTSAEHNDGLLRTMYVEDQYGSEMYELFREVKRLFDPRGIFNPGKIVDGDRHYSFSHMKHDNLKGGEFH